MSNINKLLEVIRRLRDAQDGCPWDLQQDFASIAPYTVEEAYEVADAIAREDYDGLKDELGDLLFQVVFHSRMAEEAGLFDFEAVAAAISDKMVRRHPHVFGTAEQKAAGPEEGSWERIKAAERKEHEDNSAMAGVALALPALNRAQKLGERASASGFDWPDRRGVRAKIREEVDELEEAVGTRDPAAIEDEFGDLLFAVVNLGRHLKVDAEHALTSANHKFERRFRSMEEAISASGQSFKEQTLESLDIEWRAAKKRVS